jgi:CheY-like chemotaxis protein
VVEADARQRSLIEAGIGGAEGVDVHYASDMSQALEAMNEVAMDLLLLDAAAPGVSAYALPESLRDPAAPPLIVFGKLNGAATEEQWARLAKTQVVRRVESMDRMFDQTALLLHQEAAKLPAHQRKVLEDLYESNKSLAGKKVLVVDDDMRNIFALTSVLEEYEMKILSADNGRDAIDLVHQDRSIDAVLMDIMMPEMDGLDTTRAIRTIPGCKNMPIIAVTAKAMKGDRDRCLEAGAWDYLSKPVDKEQLLATLRAWLFR